MKYTDKKFDVPVGSDAYREGWERIFGKKDGPTAEYGGCIIRDANGRHQHWGPCSASPAFDALTQEAQDLGMYDRPVLCGCGNPLMKDGWCHECGGYRG